jgi:hypothetical protein
LAQVMEYSRGGANIMTPPCPEHLSARLNLLE